VDKAEELINQGLAEYNPWTYAPEALRILVGVKTKQGKFQEALDLVEKVLSGKVTPEVEEEMLFQKGVILQQKGKAESSMTDTDKAVIVFGQVRDKFPKGPKAEEAWFALAQMLSDRDAAKAIAELEKFIAKYEEGGGLSENTAKNLPLAQYLLAKCRYQLGEKDPKNKEKAVIDYRKILEKWPDSEVGPNVLFKIFDIYNEKPDYQMCVKLMEEFVAKYPANENVYYAYNNIAELHFTGVLNTKTDANGKTIPAGPAGIKDLENGTKKLNEFADYEQSKGAEMKVKRGDTALLRIADRWLDELRKMPPFMTLNPEQKLKWQKIVDNVIAPIERQLKNYPAGPRLGDGLERLVKLQSARVKAQQTDAGQVEAYFKDLAAKYHSDQFLSAKIQAKLAEFLAETDPKRGFVVIEKIFKDVPEIVKNNGVITPSFSPLDYDRYLTGLFEAKRHDEVVKIIKRLREEYPADNSTAPENVVAEASAVALFWEGKELQEQGKNTDAGAKFDELTKKYPRSAKKMEADYGVILGDLESGKLKDEAKIREDLQRLADIVKISNTKTFELQAKALYLMGRLYEELKDYDSAVAAYVKISNRFASVPKVAGDGLWKGAQILEKQAKGEIKILTPEERKAANDKSAALIKAAAEKVKAETEKLNPSKSKDPKAQADKDAKPGAAKDAKAPVGKEAKPDAAKEPNASVDKNAKPDAPKDEKTADKPAEKSGAKPDEEKNNLENHAQC
jgi:tetratricopeptide (TPR) repeat protein